MKITPIVLLALLATAFAFGLVPRASALPKSSKVALVPDNNGYNSHGGALPTAPTGGFPNGDTFTFVNLSPLSIRDDAADPIAAGGYDTVVLVMIDSFHTWWADPEFKSRIESFVSNGGKLIIYDSENTASDYSTFTYPFTVSQPGPRGASIGDAWIVENNTLSHNNTALPSYVDMTRLHNAVDIGDANVMTSKDPNWCIDMVALNILGVQGPVHTYARLGNGLIIYNGFDIDAMTNTQSIGNANGQQVLGLIWYLELKQSFNPDNLPCGIHVSGLTLLPHTATNPIGVTHTVTAKVTDNLGNPVPNVVVNFLIVTGPNAGMTGTGTTNANGETTFSWTSLVAGIDTVEASCQDPRNPAIILRDRATKEWGGPTQVIPEAPLGTISLAIALLTAVGIFVTKSRMSKGLKLRP